MFASAAQPVKPKRSPAVIISVALHVAAFLFVVLYHASPIFVTPSSLAMGNGNKSYKLVYFAPVAATNQPEPEEQPSLSAHALKLRTARKHKLQAQQQANVADQVDEANKDARAGTAYGSLFTGPAEGHDVRPAYPVSFPDPPVSRSDFPSGFQGDVIVEVSIDKFGSVIDLRLLQGISQGIDEKVMSTLRNWRYKPATMDGEPIAEKHDVHFHYPG